MIQAKAIISDTFCINMQNVDVTDLVNRFVKWTDEEDIESVHPIFSNFTDQNHHRFYLVKDKAKIMAWLSENEVSIKYNIDSKRI